MVLVLNSLLGPTWLCYTAESLIPRPITYLYTYEIEHTCKHVTLFFCMTASNSSGFCLTSAGTTRRLTPRVKGQKMSITLGSKVRGAASKTVSSAPRSNIWLKRQIYKYFPQIIRFISIIYNFKNESN